MHYFFLENRCKNFRRIGGSVRTPVGIRRLGLHRPRVVVLIYCCKLFAV